MNLRSAEQLAEASFTEAYQLLLKVDLDIKKKASAVNPACHHLHSSVLPHLVLLYKSGNDFEEQNSHTVCHVYVAFCVTSFKVNSCLV